MTDHNTVALLIRILPVRRIREHHSIGLVSAPGSSLHCWAGKLDETDSYFKQTLFHLTGVGSYHGPFNSLKTGIIVWKNKNVCKGQAYGWSLLSLQGLVRCFFPVFISHVQEHRSKSRFNATESNCGHGMTHKIELYNLFKYYRNKRRHFLSLTLFHKR